MNQLRANSIYSILTCISIMSVVIFTPFGCRFEANQAYAQGQGASPVETAAPPLPIDAILNGQWLNPFNQNADRSGLERFVQELARTTAQTLETVTEMEKQLIESETSLRTAGFSTPAEFMTEVARLAENLPPNVKEAIRTSQSPHELAEKVTSGIAPFNGPECKELRELIAKSKEPLQDHFQEKRISHTKAYFRLALGLGLLNAYDLARELESSGKKLDEAQRAKYEKLFQRLADSTKLYLQSEPLYEGPKRNMAVTPHNDFLRTVNRISGLVDVLADAEATAKELHKSPDISSESKSLSRGMFIYLKRFVIGVVSTPLILLHATRVIMSIARDRTYQPGLERAEGAEAVRHGNLTISNSIMEITRLLTPILGFEVRFSGLNHLQRISADAVSILTPTHRDALRDMIAVAALRFKNMALYANAGQIMNMIFGRAEAKTILGKTYDMLALKRRIVGYVNRNPGVLVAGPTHNPDREDANFKPVQKGVTLMSEGIRMFLNYPHGALPSALGMDLPIVESWFGPRATLAEAWKAKFAPNLVVVTLPNNVDPLGLGLVPEHREGIVRVNVAGVVPGDLIRTTVAFGGESVLKHLFEANSNLGMVTNYNLHRGHIRTARLPEMLDRYTRRPPADAISTTLNIRACESTFIQIH